MKKFVSVLTAAVLLALCLVGCGSKEKKDYQGWRQRHPPR